MLAVGRRFEPPSRMGRAMSQIGFRHRPRRISFSVVAVAVAYVGLSGVPSSAVVYDPCGLVTQAEIAAGFGFGDTATHKTVVAAPGNTDGVVPTRCGALAWGGRKPTNEKQKAEKLHDGTMARL